MKRDIGLVILFQYDTTNIFKTVIRNNLHLVRNIQNIINEYDNRSLILLHLVI